MQEKRDTILTLLTAVSCSFKNASASRNSFTNFSVAASTDSLSAKASLSSFSRFRKSSLSSLSNPITVGVCGRDSRSVLRPSITGLTGVMLRDVDAGVDGVGDVGAFFADAVVADREPGLPGNAHSASSTYSPPRHRAISASRAAVYFW